MDVVAWPVPGDPDAQWHARPFGQTLEDLQVDLTDAAPFATTGILSACLSRPEGPVDQDEVWSWTINCRLQGLLAVTIATRGDAWTLTTKCQSTGCSELMDIPLRLSNFQRTEDPSQVSALLPDKTSIDLNIPTGHDQLAWLHGGLGTDQILKRLITDCKRDYLTPKVLKIIDATLTETDPLTALEIETICPECGYGNHIPLNLEQECLHFLADEQPRLLDDIHQLALAYHWSEAEIMAIPAARRHQYLERLNGYWQ